MTLPQAIKIMFPKKSQAELSIIWFNVFSPQFSALLGKPQVNPVILDAELIKEYGEYTTTLSEFITEKFGKEVLNDFVLQPLSKLT